MIQITEKIRNEIKRALGYPIVTDEEIYEIYSESQIDDLIEECLETWYEYFPLVVTIQLPANQNESIVDCELENVIGIVNYAQNSISQGINQDYGSLTKCLSCNIMGGNAFGRRGYGSPFNYFENEVSGSYTYQESFLNKSKENLAKDYYCKYDHINNKFITKSNTGNSLSVDVGLYDTDIMHIPTTLRKEFIKFARAKLQYEFGYALSIMNSDLPLSFNADSLMDDGKEQLETITEWMSNNSTMQAMR